MFLGEIPPCAHPATVYFHETVSLGCMNCCNEWHGVIADSYMGGEGVGEQYRLTTSSEDLVVVVIESYM